MRLSSTTGTFSVPLDDVIALTNRIVLGGVNSFFKK